MFEPLLTFVYIYLKQAFALLNTHTNTKEVFRSESLEGERPSDSILIVCQGRELQVKLGDQKTIQGRRFFIYFFAW